MPNPSLSNQNVVVRADLDVPVKDGRIENDYRLQTLLPTINICMRNFRHTLLIGHMGRPEGPDPKLSLKPIQEWLKSKLDQEIPMYVSGYSPGEWWKGESPLSLLDNLRFDPREESNDRGFAQELVTGADLYVYDAFATYRPCTSMQIIPELLKTVIGEQFEKEVTTLSRVLKNPARPALLLASGAKPDKLESLKRIAPHFDQVLYGGKFAEPGSSTPDGLDLNDQAISRFVQAIAEAQTVVLNGPLGVYEDGIHSKATKAVFDALKASKATTILGGGDTLAAIPALGFSYSDFSFVSTGGGAMLEFLATGTHPLLDILAKIKEPGTV